MRRNPLTEFARAAADFCNRKRDTIYYSTLTLGVAGAVGQGYMSPFDAMLPLSLGTWSRETGRAVSWLYRQPTAFREHAAATMVTGAAMATFNAPLAAAAANMVASDPSGAVIGQLFFGGGTLCGIAVTAYNKYQSGLTWGQVAKLYKDKLFDYPDKRDPPPPPRRRPAKVRLALQPIPVRFD